MKRPELLSPVGDFESLKAAIQNGADAVYLGSNLFSARASASNFNLDELKEAIQYSKLRDVKVNLALNTLIKNNEFSQAFEIAKKAYEYGVDAIIVQDLGFAKILINYFDDLPIHASTQLTAHNLEGVLNLQKLGFKRVVLSRELSIDEIKYICENSDVEIEVFIHGALCISYSGQCLFSSMVGGRSGNRGKCAQPCRLPYKLIENDNTIDSGYLLSPRDLCSIDNLKELIDCGVTSFKIEGRMKKPEYVATVTRIYRKYIDEILNTKNKPTLSPSDSSDLLQVFNRGGFSTGHQSSIENTNLIFKEKPNNMGIYIGKVSSINQNKGLIDIKLENEISIGDTISINDYTYHVSELMINNQNIKQAKTDSFVTIGRMKGNINKGDKIYKIESKILSNSARKSFENIENKKIKLKGEMIIKKDKPIELNVSTLVPENSFYYNLKTSAKSDICPTTSINNPITKDRILSQLSKTGNTQFEFENIDIDLEDNLYIPKISCINELRRSVLSDLENLVIKKYTKNFNNNFNIKLETNNKENNNKIISVLLNILDENSNYSELKNIDNIYIPVKYFLDNKYFDVINNLSNNFNIYIYLPLIIKNHFYNILEKSLQKIVDRFNISGFIVSNIGQINLVKKYNLEIVANYSFNVFNNFTENQLKDLNFNRYTISPELDKNSILDIIKYHRLNSELIVYGSIPLMNSNYCLLGETNKCYEKCDRKCSNNKKYYIKDRLGLNFRIIPDNIQTITTIYNSKILSISPNEFEVENIRIDILDEPINQINNIIETIISGNRLEGKEYTNGNLNREI